MKKIAVLLDGRISNDGRVRRTIESLSEYHRIDLYCLSSDFDDSTLFNENVNVFHYQINNQWLKRNLFMNKRFDDLKKTFENQQEIYDYLYVNDYPLLQLGVSLKKKYGSPLIYDSHEIYIETINQFFPRKGWKVIYGIPLIYINKWIHRRIERKEVRYVDQMITVCDSLKYYFEERLPVKDVLVVKNCPKDINVKQGQNLLREKLNLSSKDKILLYQGDVNISRGIEKMAQAMPLIDKTIHFVIVGGGPKLEEFKSKYTSEYIHFVGKVSFDKLYEYTSSADVGLTIIEPYNLSKKYALPNKVFEYMVANIPFITNSLPETSKVAKETGAGFIIDDSSPKTIAKAINDIFQKEDLEEMGRKGRKAIEEKYTWGNEVQKLLEFIKKS